MNLRADVIVCAASVRLFYFIFFTFRKKNNKMKKKNTETADRTRARRWFSVTRASGVSEIAYSYKQKVCLAAVNYMVECVCLCMCVCVAAAQPSGRRCEVRAAGCFTSVRWGTKQPVPNWIWVPPRERLNWETKRSSTRAAQRQFVYCRCTSAACWPPP